MVREILVMKRKNGIIKLVKCKLFYGVCVIIGNMEFL